MKDEKTVREKLRELEEKVRKAEDPPVAHENYLSYDSLMLAEGVMLGLKWVLGEQEKIFP